MRFTRPAEDHPERRPPYRAKALLDPKAPHLALFAAWAMQHHHHGLTAAHVVEAT